MKSHAAVRVRLIDDSKLSVNESVNVCLFLGDRLVTGSGCTLPRNLSL